MSAPYVISLSSDEEDDDDVQVLAFHHATQQLIELAAPKVVKKLCEAECPICFDTIKNATTTFCGHVYCLECLQKSISASSARGQTRGKKGVGLCPMCRKSVAFKDTIVLRLKKGRNVAPPAEKDEGRGGEESQEPISEPGLAHASLSEEFVSCNKNSPENSEDDASDFNEDISDLFTEDSNKAI